MVPQMMDMEENGNNEASSGDVIAVSSPSSNGEPVHSVPDLNEPVVV